MRRLSLVTLTTIALLAACSRTDDGKIVIERPGEVQVRMTHDPVHLPTIGTVKETVTTPVVGVKEETLIVKKPVVTSKKTEISRPAIKP